MIVPPERLTVQEKSPNGYCGHVRLPARGSLGARGRAEISRIDACPISNAAGEVGAISTFCATSPSATSRAGAGFAGFDRRIFRGGDSRRALDGTIISWNRGSEALLGYPSQEIIGKNVAILVPPTRHGEMQNPSSN